MTLTGSKLRSWAQRAEMNRTVTLIFRSGFLLVAENPYRACCKLSERRFNARPRLAEAEKLGDRMFRGKRIAHAT